MRTLGKYMLGSGATFGYALEILTSFFIDAQSIVSYSIVVIPAYVYRL